MSFNKAEIKRQAIRHYKRMIECAKSFKGRFSIDNIEEYLEEEIEETWGGGFCSYCSVYTEIRQTYTGGGYVCGKCPLCKEAETLYDIDHSCCNGAWHKIGESKNLEEFIKNLKNVLKYIRENG